LALQIIDMKEGNDLRSLEAATATAGHLWTESEGNLDGTTKSFSPRSIIFHSSTIT
jgi:hypothetical protein